VLPGHWEPAPVELQTGNQGKQLATLEHGSRAMPYNESATLREFPQSAEHQSLIIISVWWKYNFRYTGTVSQLDNTATMHVN